MVAADVGARESPHLDFVDARLAALGGKDEVNLVVNQSVGCVPCSGS